MHVCVPAQKNADNLNLRHAREKVILEKDSPYNFEIKTQCINNFCYATQCINAIIFYLVRFLLRGQRSWLVFVIFFPVGCSFGRKPTLK